MRSFIPALAAVLILSSPLKAAEKSGGGCDVQTAKSIGELRTNLGRRAVMAVNLAAARAKGLPAPELEQLIAPDAAFSTGSGDVGLPLPSGVAGMIALARDMNADSFRFLGWDSIPTPVANPCGLQEMEVDFINSSKNIVFPVKFMFRDGRIVSAEGWRRSFESGPVTAIPH